MSAVLQLRPEETSDRTSGIGGSDIAAIVGKSSWQTSWSVWARKRGILPPQPTLDELPERIAWGVILEPSILREYARRERAEDLALYGDRLFRHPKREWQIGHPDAIRTELGVVTEAKSAGDYRADQFGEPGTDELPEGYIIQVTWYMDITGLKAAHVPVLIGGGELKTFLVHYNAKLAKILQDAGETFWRESIHGDNEPPIDASPQAAEYLKHQFPRDTESIREATGRELMLASVYADTRAKARNWTELEDGLANQIKAAIGTAEGIHGEDFKITWKKTKDSTNTDWETAAREALTFVQLLASAEKSGLKPRVRQEARELASSLLKRHTAVVPGYRRIHTSGALFKAAEEEISNA